MRKSNFAVLIAFSALLLTGCGESTTSNTSNADSKPDVTSNTSGGGSKTTTSTTDTADSICFHYRDDDASSYDDTDLYSWVWKEGEIGQAVNWEGQDDYGAYATINLKSYVDKTKIGYIVRTKGMWNVFQTTDTYINVNNFKISNGAYQVYTLLEADKSLSVYDSEGPGLADKLKAADFTDWNKITVRGSNKVTKYVLKENDGTTEKEILSGTPNESTFEITLPSDMNISSKYTITGNFETTTLSSTRIVNIKNLYNTNKFINEYTAASGDPLGVTYTANSTTFRLWSPICYKVNLNIYQTGIPSAYSLSEGNDIHKKYQMEYKGKGVWEYTFNEHLDGSYYDYTLYNYLGINEIVDPYAVSVGINGLRGYAIDLNDAKTKPNGFDSMQVCDINSPKNLTVYELHVADVTSDSTWTGTEANRGKYKGLVEKGTTYEGVKTGFDHIDELGVNAVQVLPFFDFANTEDQTNEYNWGYNPENYNAPEGAYCSNPKDGLQKIIETREMVTGFSQTKAKTRVIMDVVYNHVNNANSSNFNFICPGYFFRYNADGSLANGSGCGNEVKTEAPMMRRFIKDSLVHWAKDYNIKGFRFDLMGIIDCQTLKEAAEELYKVDPTIAMYGEAWIALGDWNAAVNNNQAVSDNVFKELYPVTSGENKRVGVGCFNDVFRDAFRGKNDFYSGEFYGLNSQGTGDYDNNKANKVKDGMRGIHTDKGGNPQQVVNYLSCHDNFTLFDQLHWTLGENGQEPDLNLVGNAVASSISANLMSQGIAFINGGEEMLRTKVEVMEDDGTYKGATDAMVEMYGQKISHNSYKSNATVNAFHYDRLKQFKSVSDNIANAVKLRQESKDTFLSLNYPENCDDKICWGWGDQVPTGFAVGYKFNNTEYYVLNLNRINGSNGTVGIGNGKLKVLYSSLNKNVGKEITVSNNLFTVSKFETVVLQRIS